MSDESVEQLAEGDEKPRKSYLKKTLSFGGQLVALAVVVWMVDLWMTRDAISATPPPIIQSTISNESFSVDMLRGEPSIIHFWGTWCPVCSVEQGTIDSMGKDFPLVTFALQSGHDDEIANYLVDEGVSYRVINDNSGIISKQYGVKAVPTTFILDREGEIRFVTQGYSSEMGLRFKLWLASL